jgi:hypothetical protein
LNQQGHDAQLADSAASAAHQVGVAAPMSFTEVVRMFSLVESKKSQSISDLV